MNKLENSLIIGKKNFFLLKVLRISVEMTFNHKIIKKVTITIVL